MHTEQVTDGGPAFPSPGVDYTGPGGPVARTERGFAFESGRRRADTDSSGA